MARRGVSGSSGDAAGTVAVLIRRTRRTTAGLRHPPQPTASSTSRPSARSSPSSARLPEREPTLSLLGLGPLAGAEIGDERVHLGLIARRHTRTRSTCTTTCKTGRSPRGRVSGDARSRRGRCRPTSPPQHRQRDHSLMEGLGFGRWSALDPDLARRVGRRARARPPSDVPCSARWAQMPCSCPSTGCGSRSPEIGRATGPVRAAERGSVRDRTRLLEARGRTAARCSVGPIRACYSAGCSATRAMERCAPKATSPNCTLGERSDTGGAGALRGQARRRWPWQGVSPASPVVVPGRRPALVRLARSAALIPRDPAQRRRQGDYLAVRLRGHRSPCRRGGRR